MDLYQKAHELMPMTGPAYLDWNPNDVQEAFKVLNRSDGEISEDDRLRALGILGHAPCSESIKALSSFSTSDKGLAAVARLALCECSAALSQLYGNEMVH